MRMNALHPLMPLLHHKKQELKGTNTLRSYYLCALFYDILVFNVFINTYKSVYLYHIYVKKI